MVTTQPATLDSNALGVVGSTWEGTLSRLKASVQGAPNAEAGSERNQADKEWRRQKEGGSAGEVRRLRDQDTFA